MNKFQKSITLNTLASPQVSGPALSPETLRYFNDPYFSFLKIYCLEQNGIRWYGNLGNLGNSSKVPNTILTPPVIAEHLRLGNQDVVKLRLSDVNEADTVLYRVQETLEVGDSRYPNLIIGAEVKPGMRYRLELSLIEIVDVIANDNSTEIGFRGEKTKVTESAAYDADNSSQTEYPAEVGFGEPVTTTFNFN